MTSRRSKRLQMDLGPDNSGQIFPAWRDAWDVDLTENLAAWSWRRRRGESNLPTAFTPSGDACMPLSESTSRSPIPRVTRRKFLGTGAAAGLAGALGTTGCAGEGVGAASALGYGGHANTAAGLEDNIYTRLLGVRPHIGAHEHITTMGGSRMRCRARAQASPCSRTRCSRRDR